MSHKLLLFLKPQEGKTMENSNNGRQRRPRIQRPRVSEAYSTSSERNQNSTYGARQAHPVRMSFSNDERPSYGERRNQRSSYGESHSGRNNYGERNNRGDRGYGERNYSGSNYGERNSYGDRRSSYGERNSYGEKSGYGDRPQRRTYGKPSYSGDTSYREDRQSAYGERSSYGEKPQRRNDRPSYGSKPYGAKPSGGSRPGPKRQAAKPKKRVQAPVFRDEDLSGIGQMINRRPVIDNAQFSDNDMINIPIKEEVRLNKFLANSGVCSRREADNLIQAGCVTVNGEVVTELGTKININTDDVRFNGERMRGEEKVYIVMNKPKGFVTTASDPHADKTVMELLKGCQARVFPVGRLDKNTTGILMFTNDGEIAEKLTHPAYDKKKIYQVSLDSELKQADYEQILSGITLSDGDIAADALEYIEDNDHRKLGIEIHSGKNRIVRRIFESLGYEVKALDRVYFAGLTKKGLKRGEWRYLTEGETNLLKMGAYL